MTGKEAKEKWKKQYDYRNKYTKDNYDRISVTVPKGLKDRIKALLEDGQTVNGLINQLLTEWMQEHERQQDPQYRPV